MNLSTRIGTCIFGVGCAGLAVLVATAEMSIKVQGIQLKWPLFGLLILAAADSFRRILAKPAAKSQDTDAS